MDQHRTEINEIGEFGLIERIKKDFSIRNEKTLKGIGDDSAVISSGNKLTLLSTDMLIEGIHFDLSYFPLHHLGYKSISVNVSDITAMNGLAEQVTVSLGLSNRFSVEAVDSIYEGVKKACENFKLDLVGGDTTSSPSGLIISVAAMGSIKKENLAYRSGAKKGDIICASGDLGAAFIGLQILEREKQVYLENPEMQPELNKYSYVVERQLKPEARADLIYELDELAVIPTSMIDISDGLASDLMHICKASDCGATIYEAPI